MHGVLGETNSNPRRQTSTPQGYKSWSHGTTNVSVPEVSRPTLLLKKISTLAVSVPVNLS